MRRILLVACLLSATVTARAEPGPERELTVENHTQRTIDELYVSASTASEWGDDRLGDAQVAAGGSARVRLGRIRACVFDVQAIYDDASREERHGVDLCRDRVVAFDGSTLIRPAPATGAAHVVTIENDAARPIQQVFVSPADSGDWGDDLLRHGSLSVAGRAEVSYRGACVADLRIVYDNRAAEERRGLDLCAMGGVAIAPGWTTEDAPAVPKGIGATRARP